MGNYTQLSLTERRRLYAFLSMGVSRSGIAKKLNRHRSVIYREVNRNSEEGQYLPMVADRKAAIRKKYNHACKLETNSALATYVKQGLEQEWSPEQIAGRMKQEKQPFSVCHESIYRYIYKRKDKALYYCLRYKKPHREQRFGRKKQPCRFVGAQLINQRPPIINTREQIGHWEGDCIEFHPVRKTNITTLVERKSRLLCLIKNENKKSEFVMEKIKQQLKKLPRKLRFTITFDQGSEFANFHGFKREARCNVYYCEKRSPWQKGSNENMNGRLRYFLPRSTDLTTVTQEQLDLLARKMNNWPRKCLGFQTPKEVYLQHSKTYCRTWM